MRRSMRIGRRGEFAWKIEVVDHDVGGTHGTRFGGLTSWAATRVFYGELWANFHDSAGSWSTHGTKQTPARLACDPTRHEQTPDALAPSNRIAASVKRRRLLWGLLGWLSTVAASRDVLCVVRIRNHAAGGGEVLRSEFFRRAMVSSVLCGFKIMLVEASFDIPSSCVGAVLCSGLQPVPVSERVCADNLSRYRIWNGVSNQSIAEIPTEDHWERTGLL